LPHRVLLLPFSLCLMYVWVTASDLCWLFFSSFFPHWMWMDLSGYHLIFALTFQCAEMSCQHWIHQCLKTVTIVWVTEWVWHLSSLHICQSPVLKQPPLMFPYAGASVPLTQPPAILVKWHLGSRLLLLIPLLFPFRAHHSPVSRFLTEKGAFHPPPMIQPNQLTYVELLWCDQCRYVHSHLLYLVHRL
jgi:hypothetical protein